ncbi:hypothetical protein ACFY7H_28815 [Streptomyces sp. NPDC012794]
MTPPVPVAVPAARPAYGPPTGGTARGRGPGPAAPVPPFEHHRTAEETHP